MLGFKTKTTKNGNTFYLCVDLENKIFYRQYLCINPIYVVVRKVDYDFLVQELKDKGFEEHLKV